MSWDRALSVFVLATSTIDASPTTSIVSSMPPMERARSITNCEPMLMTMASCRLGVKPASSASTE